MGRENRSIEAAGYDRRWEVTKRPEEKQSVASDDCQMTVVEVGD